LFAPVTSATFVLIAMGISLNGRGSQP